MLAYFLRFEAELIPVTKTPLDAGQCLDNLPLVLLLATGAYQLTGQYAIHRLRRLREGQDLGVAGPMVRFEEDTES